MVSSNSYVAVVLVEVGCAVNTEVSGIKSLTTRLTATVDCCEAFTNPPISGGKNNMFICNNKHYACSRMRAIRMRSIRASACTYTELNCAESKYAELKYAEPKYG